MTAAPTTILTTTVPSPVGTLRLTAADGALTGLAMEGQRHRPPTAAGWVRDDAWFKDVAAQLAAYFEGELTDFDVSLHLDGTDFQRQVWAGLCAIPYGEAISYGELARRVGNPAAVRAIGQANGRNPVAVIVPCHRVIAADGTLGGYGGGLERKRWLLDLEQGHRP